MSEPQEKKQPFWTRWRKPSTNGKASYGYGGGYYGHGSRGGYHNSVLGAGTGSDKLATSTYIPTRFHSRELLEVIGIESWVAGRVIQAVAEDAVCKWRTFETGNESRLSRALIEAEGEYNVPRKFQELIAMGRQFGTALMVMVTAENDLSMPLNPDMIRTGDLKNLLITDRYSCNVVETNGDLYDKDFGKPLRYQITLPDSAQTVLVHESRVLRYDGIPNPALGGLSTAYDRDWGISVLVPGLTEIYRDESIASAITQIMLRNGLLIVDVDGISRMVGEAFDSNGQSSLTGLGSVMNEVSQTATAFRTVAKEPDHSVEMLSAGINGVANVMDRLMLRLSAVYGIPATRLWGRSPAGFNATGNSEMETYSEKIASIQASKLNGPLKRLDAVLLANAGINKDAPEFTWPSILRKDENVQAEVSKKKAEAWTILLNNSLADENEARAGLDGDSTFGKLPKLSDAVLDEMRQLLNPQPVPMDDTMPDDADMDEDPDAVDEDGG